MSSIADVSLRYQTYLRTEIPETISPYDDMFVVGVEGNMAHYLSVGRSAVDVIVGALVVAGNPPIGKILDLPCGGGRVTRHLRALFPESEVFVSDLNKQKESFVLSAIDAKAAESNPSFSDPPARKYDLIFVGSLVTHFDATKFRVTWAQSCARKFEASMAERANEMRLLNAQMLAMVDKETKNP